MVSHLKKALDSSDDEFDKLIGHIEGSRKNDNYHLKEKNKVPLAQTNALESEEDFF